MLRQGIIATCVLLAVPVLAMAQGAPALPPAAAPAAAPASTEPSDTMDPPTVGDHWTYELHDEITGQLKNSSTVTITDVTASEIAVRVETPGYPSGYFVYDHFWNTKNNGVWKYTPSDGTGVKLPLTVGATWKFQGDDFYSTRGVSFKRTGSSTVVGQETITTSAGNFDAFKIETTINVRNANDSTKTAQSTMTTWYVPAVDHWVKRTFKQTSNGHVDNSYRMELVDFGRR